MVKKIIVLLLQKVSINEINNNVQKRKTFMGNENHPPFCDLAVRWKDLVNLWLAVLHVFPFDFNNDSLQNVDDGFQEENHKTVLTVP